ncbi:MAG: 2-dehydropantoate 2-reductase [Rhizobiaceae bacterium]|nr:2-dehydropantoate 2-reductase [Rhizobiaceae bacterium]
MKVTIVGAGAMGSVYAALFADTSTNGQENEVWAIDVWEQHVAAINDGGLRVEGASGDRTVTTVRASSDVADAGESDLFIIATKASGVGAAARSIAPYLSPNSLVLTIQNGLGAGERIAEFMPVENVLLGVAEGFGASIKGPGHAHHNAMNLIRIGEMNGGLTPRLKMIEKLWQGAGFKAKAFGDIQQLIWEKYLCNSTYSAPCTAFNCTMGELQASPEKWAIAVGCALEVYQLGKAKGINFSFSDPIAYVREFGARMPDARPSMLLDNLAERKSEIDAINGMAPVLGEELGIATPYNQTLSAVVRDRESKF